jgi:hypothetical protein
MALSQRGEAVVTLILHSTTLCLGTTSVLESIVELFIGTPNARIFLVSAVTCFESSHPFKGRIALLHGF